MIHPRDADVATGGRAVGSASPGAPGHFTQRARRADPRRHGESCVGGMFPLSTSGKRYATHNCLQIHEGEGHGILVKTAPMPNKFTYYYFVRGGGGSLIRDFRSSWICRGKISLFSLSRRCDGREGGVKPGL
ncbi:hypothetical protein GUJ93_ZPchr0006g46008 [Zizania palustris]|uniref:Uncharacterized protein n=1 Tax=Zizania palustris TaxID=103762 RepID=A0A8J5SEQ8_ZIZPA|nr:hypothetical protein GUJ93_ZPchr0006g46008 [Zizania palustris]